MDTVLAGQRELGDADLNAPRPQQTIVVVEDETAVRTLITAVLKRRGYRVFEAPTPQMALELFQQHGDAVDLIITDVVMPDMNGPMLVERLMTVRPRLRVLFISGYADIGAPLDPANRNMSFLSKPFRASALADVVGNMLSEATSAST